MTTIDGPILVLGATGRQGGATARELLQRGHRVHALARSLDTPAAQELAAGGAELVQGDLDDPDSVRRAMQGVAAVFSVQAITAGLDAELRQALTVVDAAHAEGVGHVVYTSVDGAERDSGVPHFESKAQVEQRLVDVGIPATVLRPAFFIDNFASHVAPQQVDGELVVRFALRDDKPMQMIATADIGVFAADAIEQPDTYVGVSVALAGDELTGSQIAATMEEVSGMPTRFDSQPIEEVRAFSSDMALMFEWINDSGFVHADIPALRRQHPGLRTLRDWLHENDWQPAPAASV